jgi:hypothetical protein
LYITHYGSLGLVAAERKDLIPNASFEKGSLGHVPGDISLDFCRYFFLLLSTIVRDRSVHLDLILTGIENEKAFALEGLYHRGLHVAESFGVRTDYFGGKAAEPVGA